MKECLPPAGFYGKTGEILFSKTSKLHLGFGIAIFLESFGSLQDVMC